MNVNVIMSVYNESNTLKEIIDRVLAQQFVDKLIIVDDHSSDNSLDIIKSISSSDKRIEYFSNDINRGKGFCVRKGIENVDSGLIIIQDADKEYYPEDYQKLLEQVHDNVVVYGTRMIGKQTGHNYVLAKFANAFLTWFFNVMYDQHITDMNTCYKLFTKEMLDGITLKEDRFLIEPEISIKLAKKGYSIKEVNIRYSGRTYDEGKKIKASDGVKQAFYMIKQRFKD